MFDRRSKKNEKFLRCCVVREVRHEAFVSMELIAQFSNDCRKLSNYVTAITTLSDKLKRLPLVFQPMRSKTKTNRTMYA